MSVETLEATTIRVAGSEQASTRNLTALIGRNTIFGVLSSLVQVGTRLVTVPIVIAHLGLGGFGIWSIIMTTSAYMRFGSVGIKSAFQKYVAEATGNGTYDTTSKLLSTGSTAMLVLSVAGLIPVALFSRQLARASGVPPEFLQSAAWALSILALIMVLSNAGAAYEAMVMGAHRIDLTRKFATASCVGEAAGIIAVVHFGYGLFAMSVVMAISEMGFLTCCYFASRRVVPQIQIGIHHISGSVVSELIRFGGSYQLVSILQLTYNAMAPIAILRAYGANSAGVLAIANRLVSPVSMLQYAFLVPILSSGAMVYASGSSERMRTLVTKSFKVNLLLTLTPLALVCAFGSYIIMAWTGQTDPYFRGALWLISISVFFQGFSLLGLVLYRTTGKAVMDNVREVLRIAIVLPVVVFSRRLGFYGVLGGLAVAELVGMMFMLFTLTRTYRGLDVKHLLNDALKLAAATAGVVAFGFLAAHMAPSVSNARTMAAIKVGAISMAILLSAYPAFYLTGVLSSAEVQSILGAFRKKATNADASR